MNRIGLHFDFMCPIQQKTNVFTKTSKKIIGLVSNIIITDKKKILDMWADHFEALGTPSVSAHYDNAFCTRIATSVKDILTSCIEDPSGVLNEPL